MGYKKRVYYPTTPEKKGYFVENYRGEIPDDTAKLPDLLLQRAQATGNTVRFTTGNLELVANGGPRPSIIAHRVS